MPVPDIERSKRCVKRKQIRNVFLSIVPRKFYVFPHINTQGQYGDIES